MSVQNGCAWNAGSNVDWITITSGSSGSGDGTVDYSVEQNVGPAPERTGTATIAGKTFTVTQGAKGCNYGLAVKPDGDRPTGPFRPEAAPERFW